ncbi:helix-turn-helix domain-containing protein, partial [Corynebacterium accolens]|uniref:helix-turn-helix domain-containing protein n=1 Tax=Corynebacterium accolens TaxID=38284 RepID=UPI00254C6080
HVLAPDTITLHALSKGRNTTQTDLTYFADGSIKSTARALDCHRNTVINRLKHFHEVTGLSPLVPADAFYIEMVLYRLKHTAK